MTDRPLDPDTRDTWTTLAENILHHRPAPGPARTLAEAVLRHLYPGLDPEECDAHTVYLLLIDGRETLGWRGGETGAQWAVKLGERMAWMNDAAVHVLGPIHQPLTGPQDDQETPHRPPVARTWRDYDALPEGSVVSEGGPGSDVITSTKHGWIDTDGTIWSPDELGGTPRAILRVGYGEEVK